MGIIELPTYNPTAVEQYATDKEVRPDLQAKAQMGNAQAGLTDTVVNGVLSLAPKIKDLLARNDANAVEQAKLDIEKYRHDLALQVESNPINDSSPDYQALTDQERAAPNKNYFDKKVKEFSDKRMKALPNPKSRETVNLWNQDKQRAAGDAMFAYDSKLSKQKGYATLVQSVTDYMSMSKVPDAEEAINRGVAENYISWVDGEKWKDGLRKEVSVQGALAVANSEDYGGQKGADYLAAVKQYEGAGGKFKDLDDESKRKMIDAYNAGLNKRGSEAVEDLRKQLSAAPEEMVPDSKNLIESYQNANISEDAKKQATEMIIKKNDEALVAQFSSRISSAKGVSDLTSTMNDLKKGGADWMGEDQENKRWQLEERIRGLIKTYEAPPGDGKPPQDVLDKAEDAKRKLQVIAIGDHTISYDDPDHPGKTITMSARSQLEYDRIIVSLMNTQVLGSDGKRYYLFSGKMGVSIDGASGWYKGTADPTAATVLKTAQNGVTKPDPKTGKIPPNKGGYSQQEYDRAAKAFGDWRQTEEGAKADDLKAQQAMDALLTRITVPRALQGLEFGAHKGIGWDDTKDLDAVEKATQALPAITNIFGGNIKRYEEYVKSQGWDTGGSLSDMYTLMQGKFLEAAKADLSPDATTEVQTGTVKSGDTVRLAYTVPKSKNVLGYRALNGQAGPTADVFTVLTPTEADVENARKAYPDVKVTPNQEWWYIMNPDATWRPYKLVSEVKRK